MRARCGMWVCTAPFFLCPIRFRYFRFGGVFSTTTEIYTFRSKMNGFLFRNLCICKRTLFGEKQSVCLAFLDGWCFSLAAAHWPTPRLRSLWRILLFCLSRHPCVFRPKRSLLKYIRYSTQKCLMNSKLLAPAAAEPTEHSKKRKDGFYYIEWS